MRLCGADHPASRHPIARRAGAEGRVICETKRIRSHYVLLDVRQASRTLCAPRYKAGPHLLLSMTRLCAFVEQITLPRIIQPRLEVAPTAFLLTEPTARRERRPYPRSQQTVRASCGLDFPQALPFSSLPFGEPLTRALLSSVLTALPPLVLLVHLRPFGVEVENHLEFALELFRVNNHGAA